MLKTQTNATDGPEPRPAANAELLDVHAVEAMVNPMHRNYSLVPKWVRSALCLTPAVSVLLLVIAAACGAPTPYWLFNGICLLAAQATSIAFGRPTLGRYAIPASNLLYITRGSGIRTHDLLDPNQAL